MWQVMEISASEENVIFKNLIIEKKFGPISAFMSQIILGIKVC